MLAQEDRMQKRKPGQPRKWQSETRLAPPDVAGNVPLAQVVVDNPYSHGPQQIPAFRSLRDDVLGHLHARREIDDAMFEAGRKYERLVERSQIGSVKAMDPTKEPVDGGGGFPDPVSDHQIAAVRQLAEAARVLGPRGEAMVRAVLIERRRFKEIAPTEERYDLAYVRRRFFECLEELAVLWSFAGRK